MAAQIVSAMELSHVPWNLALSAVLGVWLMAAPAMLGVTGRRADSDYVAGALVITWAVIAFGEVARPARYLNIVMGCLDRRRPMAAVGTQCRDAVARRTRRIGSDHTERSPRPD